MKSEGHQGQRRQPDDRRGYHPLKGPRSGLAEGLLPPGLATMSHFIQRRTWSEPGRSNPLDEFFKQCLSRSDQPYQSSDSQERELAADVEEMKWVQEQRHQPGQCQGVGGPG